uniref:O-antigen ligase domain-containing protein n=1 Tax=Dictyoglomus thermophilum TaxID=14 RepID=A0A7C3RIJ0_DICTH
MNIILVFSRTAYIGLVFSLFMYYIIYHIVNFYRINLLSLLRRILRFLLVTILLYILMINIPHFKEKIIIGFETVNKVIKFGEIKEGESDYRRYLLIKESIRIFKEHWLLGTGLGLENYLYYFNENTIPAKPHSLYLSYLAEFGLIGFSFLVLFLFSILQVLYKTILYTIGKKEVYLSIGFFVGHLTILIMFLFNEYITAPYTWFFWATAVAYSLLVRKER